MAIPSCIRPGMEAEDSIVLNCADYGDPNDRDNYYRLPLLLAPMAPSGPIEWGITEVVDNLPDVSLLCDTSYDPLQAGGFWEDLAALFADAGFQALLDSEYCFDVITQYTVTPIDPVNDLISTDLATYNWQTNFDFSKSYYRPSGGGGGGGGELPECTANPSVLVWNGTQWTCWAVIPCTAISETLTITEG